MADLSSLFNLVMGGNTVNDVSNQVGADGNKVQAAIGTALPLIVSALSKNSSNESGAGSLFNAISKDHDGSVLNNVGSLISNPEGGDGMGILKHVFGNKLGTVENTVSKSSGLDMQSVIKILTILAPIVMGFLGKKKSEENLNAGGVSGLLNSLVQNSQSQAPKEMSLINQLLDSDNDGDVSDDIANIGVNLLGNFLGGKK